MELADMVDVIELCTFPEYEFRVIQDRRGAIYLQASYLEPDTETHIIERQVTRRWFLSPEMTPSEIAQTAFKCVLTSMEHRTREWFKYDGEPVYGPHLDVAALHSLVRAKRFAHRQKKLASEVGDGLSQSR